MNIIFLTMSHITEVRTSGIYSDLMRKEILYSIECVHLQYKDKSKFYD